MAARSGVFHEFSLKLPLLCRLWISSGWRKCLSPKNLMPLSPPRLKRNESSSSVQNYFHLDSLQKKLKDLEEENVVLRSEVKCCFLLPLFSPGAERVATSALPAGERDGVPWVLIPRNGLLALPSRPSALG